MEPSSRRRSDGPEPLGSVVSQFLTLRGYGRVQTGRQLQEIWRQLAGAAIASRTKVQGIRNGILHITVDNSSLLQELEGFHKRSLHERLTTEHSDLRIRDLRFRLQSTRRG
jgi:predicted nucleic acid-binding Zn ribbon protein